MSHPLINDPSRSPAFYGLMMIMFGEQLLNELPVVYKKYCSGFSSLFTAFMNSKLIRAFESMRVVQQCFQQFVSVWLPPSDKEKCAEKAARWMKGFISRVQKQIAAKEPKNLLFLVTKARAVLGCHWPQNDKSEVPRRCKFQQGLETTITSLMRRDQKFGTGKKDLSKYPWQNER